MRSDFTPQVETREIADSELDNVSGGVLGVDVAGAVAPVLGALDAYAPVSATVAQVTGLVPAPAANLLGL